MKEDTMNDTAVTGADSVVNTSHLMQTYKPAPVVFVRGEGPYLFDTDGNKYLDFLSGIAVTSLGHAHDQVAAAIAKQARELLHVSNLFHNDLAQDVASMLDSLIIGDSADPAIRANGGKVFFANSGAEAVECALKLSRKWGGGTAYKVVAFDGSFHGRTFGALSATGQPKKKQDFLPMLDGFIHLPYVDVDLLAQCLEQNQIPEQNGRSNLVAAVLIEPIQGENGILLPLENTLAEVRELCNRHNVLMVVDEIQTGLGRTGKWFAFQHDGIIPDVVTMAKSLGNGMPIGACWAKSTVADCFMPGDHGTTFGGQPLALSAAKATLDALLEIRAPETAHDLGQKLREALSGLEGVEYVRGKGLLLGVKLSEDIDASAFTTTALSLGLIANSPVTGIVRLAPPYVIDDTHISEATELFKAALRLHRKGKAG